MANKKMGRPKKVPTEEMLAIVNRYAVEMSDVGPSFSAHGIYRKLSDYAKSLGYPLEPHDFSRCKEVLAYIKALDVGEKDTGAATLNVPAFEPLDIPTLINSSKKRIEEAMRSRESYFESLHLKASRAIESYITLAKKVEHLQAQVKSLERKNDSLVTDKDSLQAALKQKEVDVAYLTRIIRKNVEPELAQQYFLSLHSEENRKQIVGNAVTSSLLELSREDRQIRAKAEQEVADLSLLSLFGEN